MANSYKSLRCLGVFFRQTHNMHIYIYIHIYTIYWIIYIYIKTIWFRFHIPRTWLVQSLFLLEFWYRNDVALQFFWGVTSSIWCRRISHHFMNWKGPKTVLYKGCSIQPKRRGQKWKKQIKRKIECSPHHFKSGIPADHKSTGGYPWRSHWRILTRGEKIGPPGVRAVVETCWISVSLGSKEKLGQKTQRCIDHWDCSAFPSVVYRSHCI